MFTQLTDFEAVRSILPRISIFGGVPEDKQIEILRQLQTGRYLKGESVFRRGDEPTHIYIVKSGAIDLRVTDGNAIFDKAELGVGETFGEASLISMHTHTATAIAVTDSEVIALSRRALIQLQQEQITLFALLIMNIARELARRLKLTDDILLHYLQPKGSYGSENLAV